MFSKLFRKIHSTNADLCSWLRRVRIHLLYPNVRIKNTVIGKGCRIRCTNEARLTITGCVLSDYCSIVAERSGRVALTNSFIGRNALIVGIESIVVEHDCQIAEMVVIRDQNHNFGSAGKTIMEQGFSSGPIHIGSNVWIGCKATILAGVSIGSNSVIGAHSLVNGNADANSVYVGIPARKAKSF